MNRRLLLMAGVFLSASPIFAKPSPALRGYYQSQAQDPESPDNKGKSIVQVDLYKAPEGDHLFIDFMVTRNPPGKILGATCATKENKEGTLEFAFKDGWDNKGKGRFQKVKGEYLLYLELVERGSKGGSVANLYGNYTVHKTSEVGRADRHPWSMGR